MSQTDRLLRSSATFRRLTGIDPTAFRQLLAELRPAWDHAEGRRGARPGRRRQAGAGRKFALPRADRLLMLLIYYRTYVPHTFLGFLFGVDDSTVSRNNRQLEPLLAGSFRIPERQVDLRPEGVRELFFDSADRPTYRPARGQRRYYNGKKRRHTIKHRVVVVCRRKRPGPGRQPRRRRIAAVSAAFPGSVHDKRVYDATGGASRPGRPGTGARRTWGPGS